MKTVDDILAYSPTAHLTDEAYAWCWALSYLLDHDPRFRDRFRQVYRDVGKPTLTSNFRRAMGNDWHLLSVQWLVLAGEIDYGYDVQRTMLDLSLGRELAGTGPAAAKIVTIAADRGWQNTGIRLKAGETYRIRAAGRYQVASEPRRWISEPGGVTIRYYRGRPLGILLAAVVPDHAAGPEKIAQAILQPTTVGLYRMVTPPVDGTLLLKINDSPGQLHDNAGTLRAEITAP